MRTLGFSIFAILVALGVGACDSSGMAEGPPAEDEVQSQTSALIWSRCVGGMSWDGAHCVGEPLSVGWDAAKRKCADIGKRLPTVDEANELLGGACAVPELQAEENIDRPLVCVPCAETASCSQLLVDWPTDGADEWTATVYDEGSSSWGYSLISGRIDNGAIINAYYFRCVR